jgi:vancomycin resistance protein VanW
MGLQQLVQNFKASVRQQLKNRNHVHCGYTQHFARGKANTDAQEFAYLWGQCITPIKQRSGSADINANRLWNMELAMKYLSGLVLQPGEIFSFWDQVPQPTLRSGFRVGPMLIRGQLQTDVGGGLCQISTTLFGAFLQANCEILEHYNHSIDAHGSDRFFILGQDAAVAYGFKDLMVCNSNLVPLQIRLELIDKSMAMAVSLWGTEPCPQRVRIQSKVLEALSPSQPQGITGWRVETHRWITVISVDSQPLEWHANYHFVSVYKPYPPQ